MKKAILLVVGVFLLAGSVSADIFGTGANQFTIDFVNISGDASSVNGTNISQFSSGDDRYKTFIDPGNYRMGTYEITNDQWSRFQACYGTVTGSPATAYNDSPEYTGANVPTNYLSWYEGAQFVNYLNTSTGHQAAYKFTGTQGQSDYIFSVWELGDIGYDADNPFRNTYAYYFMPTEDEWVKAAYWNGTSLQEYANASPGDLISGFPDTAKWNYGSSARDEPWDVGSGSEELNGTFDMMGNVWEWMESPSISGDFLFDSGRASRGSSHGDVSYNNFIGSSYRHFDYPHNFEFSSSVGFRVASVPEPATILLFGLGGLMLRKRRA